MTARDDDVLEVNDAVLVFVQSFHQVLQLTHRHRHVGALDTRNLLSFVVVEYLMNVCCIFTPYTFALLWAFYYGTLE